MQIANYCMYSPRSLCIEDNIIGGIKYFTIISWENMAAEYIFSRDGGSFHLISLATRTMAQAKCSHTKFSKLSTLDEKTPSSDQR